jgi:hypothetical protein
MPPPLPIRGSPRQKMAAVVGGGKRGVPYRIEEDDELVKKRVLFKI